MFKKNFKVEFLARLDMDWGHYNETSDNATGMVDNLRQGGFLN